MPVISAGTARTLVARKSFLITLSMIGLLLLLPGAAMAFGGCLGHCPKGFKTRATLMIADQSEGNYMVLAGLLQSDNPRCRAKRSLSFYYPARKKFLGSRVTNKNGVGTLQVKGIKAGAYLVKVQARRLPSGNKCLATKDRKILLGGNRISRAQSSKVLPLEGRGSTGSRKSVSSPAQISKVGRWKKCGEFYLSTPKQPVLFQAKRLQCLAALEIIAHAIVDPGVIRCLIEGCRALDYNCARIGQRFLIRCVQPGTGSMIQINGQFRLPVINFAGTRVINSKNCGQVENNKTGSKFYVKVTKGSITCRQARKTTEQFMRTHNCGSAMIAACVAGAFHCRIATPQEFHTKGLSGYCYKLKRPVPAARDYSFYKPKNFRAAITMRTVPN